MAPKKVDAKKRMTERLTLTCTKTEAAMIQEAIEIAERHNVSDYMRSIVMPHAKALVTNQRLFIMAENFSKPDFLLNMAKAGFEQGVEQGIEQEFEQEFENLTPEAKDALKQVFGNSVKNHMEKNKK